MFDSLKRRKETAKSAGEQVLELQALINAAREERGALSTMLTQIEVRAGKVSLPQVSKAVQLASDKASAATEQLQAIGRRLDEFEARGQQVVSLEGRVKELTDAVSQAQDAAAQLLAPDGELQKHRTAVQQLSSQALQTGASLEALKKDQAALDQVRDHLRQSLGELKAASERGDVLRAELEQLRSASAGLAKDYQKLRDSVRQAKEESVATAETVKEIDTKLGHFKELHELSKSTEERIGALNALAEHVTQKTKALENQKHTIEHAVVESNRLNEMVWNMDVQIAKLKDGGRQAEQADAAIQRIEELAREVQAQLDTATKSKAELADDVTKLARDREELEGFMRGYQERLAVERKEVDAFDQRVGALREVIGTVEQRVDAVVAKDREAAAIGQRLEEVSGRLGVLSTQTDELQERQHELESLQDRLGQVEELSKTNRWHYENLTKSREGLDQARKDIEAFYTSYGEAAKLREQLGADRFALEAFFSRVDSFNRQIPDLDARMNAIASKLSIVDEGTQKAAALATTADALDQQMTRLTAQQQHVERVEARLQAVHELSRTVDGQIAEQVGRSGEIEALRNLCDGLTIQVTDAQHKLEAVGAFQHRLLPMATQVKALSQQLDKAQRQFTSVKKTEEEILEQGRRLTDLQVALRELGGEVDGRLKQVQGLSDDLGRASGLRDELIEELNRVQYRQREVGANLQSAEDQLKRAEATTKQLERRRSQLAFGEKKISQFEARLAELKGLADELEQQIQSIAARGNFVGAIKKEVEGIHTISERSRADLQHVAEHRQDVVKLKERVDEVLACIAETEQRMATIETRRRSVDEAQRKTNVIVNLLEDVRVNLETLTEQKSVIDHVIKNLASLNATVQAAKATQQALQAERELAERIEGGIKQLRARTEKPGRQRSA